ncbi:MAG: hypothetical protein ACO3HT_09655 [Ilumatobacteraceae bacterium]
MTDHQLVGRNWRPTNNGDIGFLYHLAASIEPRWWQISKDSLNPLGISGKIGSFAAGVTIHHGEHPCGFGALRGQQGSDVAFIEFYSLHEEQAIEVVTSAVPEIVTAAFVVSPVRKLLYERFEDDPDLIAKLDDVSELEYRLPEFAKIDGKYVDRLSFAIEKELFLSRYAHLTEGLTDTDA